MSDRVLRRQFRTLLANIGSGLSSKNSRQLRFIYEFQGSMSAGQDTDVLDILDELMTQGEFDAHRPEKLQDILESIGRKDFSDAIKDYKKSPTFKAVMKEKKKGKVVHQPRSIDEGLLVPVQLQTVPHSTSYPHMLKDPIVLQLTKTIEAVIEGIETITKEESKKQEVDPRITAMKTEMTKLKKMMPELKKEKAHAEDEKSKKKGHLMKTKQIENFQDRGRSNSLDSKLKNPKSTKGLPDIHSHLQVHKPIPTVAILCPELCDKLREQHSTTAESSDSGSNTSSGSSIALEESRAAATTDRYVTVPTKKDMEQESRKRTDQADQDEPVYDEPNGKRDVRPYVNVPLLPLNDYSTLQEDRMDPTRDYANIRPKAPVEHRH